MSNQVLDLTVKHISDDGKWTEVIWESKVSFDILYPQKKMIRSGYTSTNRMMFYDNVGGSPFKCSALIGKTFVAEVYFVKNKQQWRVKPRTLSSTEKMTPFQEAVSKISLPQETNSERVTVNPEKVTIVKPSVKIGSGRKSHATKILKDLSKKMLLVTPLLKGALQKDNLRECRPGEYELIEQFVAMLHAEE